MKKFLLGLLTVIITIVSGFAFKKPLQNQKTVTLYYFLVANTVTPGNETSAVLTFPFTVPPTSATCLHPGTVYDCWLAYRGWYLDANLQYEPGDLPNASSAIPQSSYNNYEVRLLRDRN